MNKALALAIGTLILVVAALFGYVGLKGHGNVLILARMVAFAGAAGLIIFVVFLRSRPT
jgi:hypothetical protein